MEEKDTPRPKLLNLEEHLLQLFCHPDLVSKARGSLIGILKRLTRDCQTEECQEMMNEAIKTLKQNGQLEVKKTGKILQNGENEYRLRWKLTQENRRLKRKGKGNDQRKD